MCGVASQAAARELETVTARRYLTFTFAGEETPTSGGRCRYIYNIYTGGGWSRYIYNIYCISPHD